MLFKILKLCKSCSCMSIEIARDMAFYKITVNNCIQPFLYDFKNKHYRHAIAEHPIISRKNTIIPNNANTQMENKWQNVKRCYPKGSENYLSKCSFMFVSFPFSEIVEVRCKIVVYTKLQNPYPSNMLDEAESEHWYYFVSWKFKRNSNFKNILCFKESISPFLIKMILVGIAEILSSECILKGTFWSKKHWSKNLTPSCFYSNRYLHCIKLNCENIFKFVCLISEKNGK